MVSQLWRLFFISQLQRLLLVLLLLVSASGLHPHELCEQHFLFQPVHLHFLPKNSSLEEVRIIDAMSGSIASFAWKNEDASTIARSA